MTAHPAVHTHHSPAAGAPIDWGEARSRAYAAGRAAGSEPIALPLALADGYSLAEPLTALTDLPAFPTSSVDGWAVRGPGPWRVIGRVLAGSTPPPLTDEGTAVEIATGAMVPPGATAILRTEESTRTADGRVSGVPRPEPEWRLPGDEAHAGDVLVPAGTPVNPGVIGLAAACGYDTLRVRPLPRAGLLVFGDELLIRGRPGAGRVRDALGPSLPAWLRRYGCRIEPSWVTSPIADTLPAHVDALRRALTEVDIVCTTGGTMRGPVDHLHPALRELGAEYVVNTVAVRPGFPMLLARVVEDTGRVRFIAGLPGNPQSAVVALATLVAPLVAGWHGRPEPPLAEVLLGERIPGRGAYTHVALVRVEDGLARPLRHAGSAMLRGVARADGFAVIRPGTDGMAGQRVPFLALPLLAGERP